MNIINFRFITWIKLDHYLDLESFISSIYPFLPQDIRVKIGLYVRMDDRVCTEISHPYIITINWRGCRSSNTKLNPKNFNNSRIYSLIFSFCGGSSYRFLLLWWPKDWIGAKENSISTCGWSIIRIIAQFESSRHKDLTLQKETVICSSN